MELLIKSNKTAVKYALISVLLWSTVASAFKISLKYLSPQELVLFSSFFSLIILFVILFFQKKLNLVFEHIKNNFFLTLFLAFINPFLYYLVLFKAYDLLSAQEAQAINYTWALMLTFLSVIFLKQKMSRFDILAGFICYFGVLIIATKGEPFSLNFSNIEGLLYAFLSTILWSFYWIFNTKNKCDPVVGLFSNFLLSLPMIFIYVYFTKGIHFPELKGLLSSSYVGFFEMGITFMFWLKAMQSSTNTSKIANLIFISPFISLIFISILLDEPIYISTIFGLSFIILGLIIQQKK